MLLASFVLLALGGAGANTSSQLQHDLAAHKQQAAKLSKTKNSFPQNFQNLQNFRRQQDCGGQGTTWGPGIGPPPTGCGGGGAPAEGQSSTCETPPCVAADLGDVGFVTVSGSDSRTGKTFAPGENIYGPFEAGFTSTQDNILSQLGCATGKGYVAGGIDTLTAEAMVAFDCGVSLPRIEGGDYISLLDECGGHTQEYHFHERLTCLYDAAASGHSTQVGVGLDGQYLYGKSEYEVGIGGDTRPLLDACGGHFGVTPDSAGEVVYHYHVQDSAPFTFGCFGPILDDASGNQKLITLAECRALYPKCSDEDNIVELTTSGGTFEYNRWCPCFDANGSNVGTEELAVFASGESIFGPPSAGWDASGVEELTMLKPDDAGGNRNMLAAGVLAVALMNVFLFLI